MLPRSRDGWVRPRPPFASTSTEGGSGSASCSAPRRSTMPERWERELSKLRDLEAPGADVHSRIEGGPRSKEGPPRHDRVIAALVAVAVAVVAGGFLWQTLPGTS